MEKLAAIYERKGTLFVLAAHRTKAGYWINDEQVVSISQPTLEELGHTIEQALARSQDGVPTPPPNAQTAEALLSAAGVRSWGTFMKVSRHLTVSCDGGALKVTPYRNLGMKEGFEPDPDLEVPSCASASALGRIVAEFLLLPEDIPPTLSSEGERVTSTT